MTFPRDVSEDMYKAEDHSLSSILAVSTVMIAAALVSLTVLV